MIYNGLELEIGWLPLLVQGSRNRRVLPGSDGSLDASRGLAILEVPAGEVDRSMGDIHPQGNPHYALDPRNGLRIAAAVAARLQQLAPERSAELSRNLEAFQTDLSRRIQDWEGQAGPLRGRKIIAFHKQWEYLAAWLELDIVDYVEVKPGIPPGPRHIADLVERMRREDIALILQANFGDARPAERVAERAGARVLRLPAAVNGEEGIDSYPDLFETIVQRLVASLEDP